MKSTHHIPSLTERADYYELETAAEQGLLLPRASAMALEETLEQNQFDLYTRARLFGFYSKTGTGLDKKRRENARLSHILWFIEHVPDCKFAGNKYFEVDAEGYPEFYAQVKKAWSKAIEQDPTSIQPKINTAMFLSRSEPKVSIRLLKTILRESPRNLWASRLLCLLRVVRAQPFVNKVKLPDNFDFEKWRVRANQVVNHLCVFHAGRMPPVSVRNLEAVLSNDPFDITARAELIGYYRNHWKRANILQVDPESLEGLTSHLLWCIEHIPGSDFLGDWHVNGIPDKKRAPLERAAILEAWNKQVKAFPDDVLVMANAARFYTELGQDRKVDVLIERIKSIGTNDRHLSFLLKSIKHRRKFVFKPLARKETIHALETVSVEISTTEKRPSPGSYTLAEWASEVDLGGAHLEGSHWIPRRSIENLEAVLSVDSHDVYNRAKIIGSYSSFLAAKPEALSKLQRKSYLRHLQWCIENIPENRIVSIFDLSSLKKHESKNYDAIKKMLLAQVKASKANIDVLVNVAVALQKTDEAEAKNLAQKISETSSIWGDRIWMILGRESYKPNANKVLKELGFRSGANDPTLQRLARLMNISQCSSSGTPLPRRTNVSNEWALKKNPKDLVLRSELIVSYVRGDQFFHSFKGLTPDVIPQLVSHNVWLIQNIPSHYLHSGALGLQILDRENDWADLGDHAILLAAAQRQLRAYPEELKIGLAMTHYFPIGKEREEIVAIRKIEKRHPRNKKIADKLKHLHKLLGIRADRKGRQSTKKAR